MRVGGARRDAPTRGAHQESLLNEERLDDIFDRAALLAHRRGQTVHAHRAAVEFLDDGQQQLAVEHVEAFRVDFQHRERGQAQLRR